MEYVVKSTAERLVKMGHEVTVLAGETEIEKPHEEEINDVHVIRWPTWNPSGAYHIPRRPTELKVMIGHLASQNDVIHIHSAHAVLPVYAGLAAKNRARLVFTLHYHGGGHTLVRKLLWGFAWLHRVRELVKAVNAVHAVSKMEGERVVKDFPDASGKLCIIPNGIDEDVLQYRWIGQDSNYAVYAGRLERYKRIDKAMELTHKLGLRLLIIGQGPDKPRLAKLAERYDVEFRDFLPRDEYLRTIASARYAINLSEAEAFSIFVAEAIAMGVPSIVSRIIAGNLNMRGEEIASDALLVKNANIQVWNEVVEGFLGLYDEVMQGPIYAVEKQNDNA
ncbi:glycosyltransferase family 4 protein [Thermocladium modestius]|uniref:glycosyltransferase family 4 protein n=1 Tax=Thermocladium modestius TaxID=62609 RepID=UPI001E5A6D29|nr:glycosyltransferase family 4 protein [Thermocladium modestius]